MDWSDLKEKIMKHGSLETKTKNNKIEKIMIKIIKIETSKM